jgi:hypothetical protein
MQAMQLKMLAKAAFKANAIQLPVNWQQPTGEAGKQYVDACKPEERFAPPDPLRVFGPASVNKYHVDTAKKIGKQFEDYIDGICDAIAGAQGQWQTAATFVGVTINGPVAAAGQIVGPPLTPLILAQGPKSTPMQLKYTNAIATQIGTAWLTWSAGTLWAAMLREEVIAPFCGVRINSLEESNYSIPLAQDQGRGPATHSQPGRHPPSRPATSHGSPRAAVRPASGSAPSLRPFAEGMRAMSPRSQPT